MPNTYLKLDEKTLDEAKMLKDASAICDGASNPLAVAGVLHRMMQALSVAGRGGELRTHVALRAVLDHLCVLMLDGNHPNFGMQGYQDLYNTHEALNGVTHA